MVIENGINDWQFLKGICEKYTNQKKRKSIYKLLKEAIKDFFIESYNAGGHGEITKIVEDERTTGVYKDIEKYKLMALFDSDRTSSTAMSPYHSKIEYFTGKNRSTITIVDYVCNEAADVIIWHILYKKKLENYVPLNQLYKIAKSITPVQKTILSSKNPQELDFIEYGKPRPTKPNLFDIGMTDNDIKDKFPETFLNSFSYTELEERCEHHKVDHTLPNGQIEQITEMEEILLKMAKII